MNKTLLIALLGATITLATPSLSFADNGYKFKSGSAERNHQHKHKHGTRHHHKNNNKKFVAKPPKKRQVVKQTKRVVKNNHANNKNKRDYRKNQYTNQRNAQYNKQRNSQHNYKNNNRSGDPSFSITWNAGNSTVTYGNGSFNNGYNNGHNKRNTGKLIYGRLNTQASRIRNGINNGQLVNREVSRLRNEQRNIKQTMSHYKRDGHLNRYERSKLNQLLDVASNNIQRKSTNHRTRYAQNHNHYNNYNNHFVQF